ncbi:type II toxin-antitoxin system RelE/ParE family toxin [bacterium]|nr:type II toxin-antitoxin system RelE/ParE family toxin [bacterium]
MDSYKIRWSDYALNNLSKTHPTDTMRIVKKVNLLKNNPNLGTKLRGGFKKYRRIRVGKYRVIYRKKEDVLTILVLNVGKRENIYKKGISG